MCGLAGRVAVARRHLVQAHEIIQEVHLHAAAAAEIGLQLSQEWDPVTLEGIRVKNSTLQHALRVLSSLCKVETVQSWLS
jgi:hypothetical protein